MKHWQVTGPRQLEAFHEPDPEPGPDQVLVKMAYTALSPGSNLHGYVTGPHADGWQPGKRTEALYMGSGTIVSVGDGVDVSRIGERVAFSGVGHQSLGVLPSRKAIRVPESLELGVASLAYLPAWSVSALHLAEYAAAESVVVIGLGLVGASAALVANAMGARTIALDALPERLAFGDRLGLGAVADARTMSESTAVRDYLGEAGADIVIDTSGSWSGFRTAIGLARDYSRIALMGIAREVPPPDLVQAMHRELFGFPSHFHYQRIKVIGCGSDPDQIVEPMPRMGTRDRNFAWVLEQAGRGRLPLELLETSRHPAAAVGDVLQRMADGDRSDVGMVFDWTVGPGETT